MDFWYDFEPDTQIFHLFYLNADRSLVANEQHHFSAQVGYATTKDFLSIEWHTDRDLGFHSLIPHQKFYNGFKVGIPTARG